MSNDIAPPPPPPELGGVTTAAVKVLLTALFDVVGSGSAPVAEAVTVWEPAAGMKLIAIGVAVPPERTTSKLQVAAVAASVHTAPGALANGPVEPAGS